MCLEFGGHSLTLHSNHQSPIITRDKSIDGSEKRKKDKERSKERERGERGDRSERREKGEHRKSERKSTRKSVKYVIDDDGNKVAIPREDRGERERKGKRRSSAKDKNGEYCICVSFVGKVCCVRRSMCSACVIIGFW